MRNLSSRVQYALLAAMDLAAHYDPKKPVKVADIARRTGAPANYLGQILLRLKARALVRSTPGRAGGYTLMRRPELISVAEVMEAVAAGPDRRRRRPAAAARRTASYKAQLDWLAGQMDGAMRALLSSVTLADFLKKATAGER